MVTDCRFWPESPVTIPEWSVTFARNEAEFALELTFSWLSCPIFTPGEPMPAKRSGMRKIKEVLRLKFEAKTQLREDRRGDRDVEGRCDEGRAAGHRATNASGG